MACTDCLGRTPFASIIASVIVCLGVGLFCGTLYRALDITINGIFVGLFWFNVPWLETIQITFIIVAVVMGVYSLILMVFGSLATGATRDRIYSGANCIFGGRVSAIFFLVLTYILNIAWIGMTGLMAIPIILYVMLNSICVHEYIGTPPWYLTLENCLNLSRFGIYRNFTEGVDKNALCDETELSEFCQHVTDLGPMYGLACGGSLLIVLGLTSFLLSMAQNYVHIQSSKELTSYKQVAFLISLTANYNKIKLSKELTEYRQAADLEVTESTYFDGSNPRRQY